MRESNSRAVGINHVEFTLQCLSSIARVGAENDFEVIVVDDASDDGTAQYVANIPTLTYIRNDANRGFIDACNRGASIANGHYLLFLNNDTEVQPGWLDELVGTFELFPEAGLVGSRLVYPDGRLQEAGGIIWNDASGCNYGRGDDPKKPEYNYLREVGYVSGASIMVRKSLFDELGGVDTYFAPAYTNRP